MPIAANGPAVKVPQGHLQTAKARIAMNQSLPSYLFAIAVVFVAHARADDADVVFADFEQPTYEKWQASGEAFGPGPAQGTLPNQMAVDGFLGQQLVNSFH